MCSFFELNLINISIKKKIYNKVKMANVGELAELSSGMTLNSCDDFERALNSFSRENCVVFCVHK